MSGLGKAEAIRRLQSLLGRVPELKNFDNGSPQFVKWKSDVCTGIRYIFGESGHHLRDFNSVSFGLSGAYSDTPDHVFHAAYVRGLDKAAALIESMIDEIKIYRPDDDQPQISSAESDRDVGGSQIDKKFVSNAVFLIHGRDNSAKESVARFLQKLGVEAVILDETAKSRANDY